VHHSLLTDTIAFREGSDVGMLLEVHPRITQICQEHGIWNQELDRQKVSLNFGDIRVGSDEPPCAGSEVPIDMDLEVMENKVGDLVRYGEPLAVPMVSGVHPNHRGIAGPGQHSRQFALIWKVTHLRPQVTSDLLDRNGRTLHPAS